MLGKLLGERYKIISILGAGGFGQTYLAEDTQQPGNPQCVVKQFKPASQDARFLEVARRLFDTEAEALRRLGQHDQIPELFDFFEDNQEFYLVQEFVDGVPLSEELSRSHRLSEAEAMILLQDVLSVLDFVHSNRVIHRDIKPGNLIRRHRDGKIVLIDFGAVKEIRTQLLGELGQSSFTVGIGTHGYTPTEQLAGKPRYCSDIYALGMTAIQSLTGLQPSQLEEDPDTSEVLWQEEAEVSLGMAFVLSRMIRFHFSQRYQTAKDVLQALQRVSELPTDLTEIPPSLLLPASLLNNPLPTAPPQAWSSTIKAGLRVVAIATLTITSLVLGVRQIGGLEPLERAAYDQMVRLRPEAPPDPRLLIVTITEEDLQKLKRPTPSDRDVASVIEKLEQAQPRAIGLDLYRELPQQPGQAELSRQLQSPNVIVVMNLGGPNTFKIPPPAGVPAKRVGFNDFPIDPDGVVRSNLMFAKTFYSFSLRVALQYLSLQGIVPHQSSIHPDYVQIGETVFFPLQPNSGGYQVADTAGYQILLNYRSASKVARQVAFTDVLQGKIDPAWIKDKVVLIGTTAPSGKDLFNTPYSGGHRTDFQMPGVTVHAQMVSQILSTVLDQQPLFWFLPEWVEILWIAGWAGVGGSLAWLVRHPVGLGLGSIVMLGAVSGVGFMIFLNQGWVPIIAPAIASIVTGAAVLTYQAHRSQKQQQELTELIWNTNSPKWTQPSKK